MYGVTAIRRECREMGDHQNISAARNAQSRLGTAVGHALRVPVPDSVGDSVLDTVAYHDLGLYTVIRNFYFSWMVPARLVCRGLTSAQTSSA